MSVEFVSRMITFDDLSIEASVYRWICDKCGARETFHDVPTPYGEQVKTPDGRGWALGFAIEDGEETPCYCPACATPSPHSPPG